MANDESPDGQTSFLGVGWSFPPRFSKDAGGVQMTADEDDIRASLRVLFSTAPGERLFLPSFGLSLEPVLFEPLTVTLRTLLIDQVTINLLVFEPRIRVLSLTIEKPDPMGGELVVSLAYEVRATNSRFNLVFPFYLSDANEARASVGLART